MSLAIWVSPSPCHYRVTHSLRPKDQNHRAVRGDQSRLDGPISTFPFHPGKIPHQGPGADSDRHKGDKVIGRCVVTAPTSAVKAGSLRVCNAAGADIGRHLLIGSVLMKSLVFISYLSLACSPLEFDVASKRSTGMKSSTRKLG